MSGMKIGRVSVKVSRKCFLRFLLVIYFMCGIYQGPILRSLQVLRSWLSR